jgi:hypothetical protein
MKRSFEAMAKYTPEQLEAVRDFMRDATALSIAYAEELRASRDGTGDREGTVEAAG